AFITLSGGYALSKSNHTSFGLRAPEATRRPARRTVRISLEHLESRDVPALFNVLSPASVGLINNFGCVATGDFNTDGKPDIVMTNYGLAGPGNNAAGNTIVVRLGQADGTFSG